MTEIEKKGSESKRKIDELLKHYFLICLFVCYFNK